MATRYVAICGGLGNQMFQYAYLVYLNSIYGNVNTFIPEPKWEHEGGFELKRVFDIEHKPMLWESLYHKGFPFTRLFHWSHKTFNGRNFKFRKEDLSPDSKYRYFYGTWQSEKYFKNPELIRQTFIFDRSKLSDKTKKIAKEIESSENTCSVHIRRGDYLSESFVTGYGNCCPVEYYKKSIACIQKNGNQEVRFIFFSDDIEWVKENLDIEGAIYVNHNHGADSWQDMFLMSLCNHNIIANSTFSWWAAWLNNHADKIVIAPKRWWSTIENDDVVPENWIRL